MIDYEQQASERLASVNGAIAHTAKIADRKAGDVTLIAVSKTYNAAAVAPFIAAGQRVFGENRVQEAQSKFPPLIDQFGALELHLVGQLQSNKAGDAVALFHTIHSVDRESLITAIARASDSLGKRPRCFIQVNIGEEAQKGGCAIAALPALLAAARIAALDVAGLMAVPPADTEAAPYFALLAKLARDHGLAKLSMGMTGDFETAIMLGATHIRIGSALFGARS
ncbi:MAG: YggS family pyridoxal phosphate-dependent enzyme [Pseudomonadota bacterium]